MPAESSQAQSGRIGGVTVAVLITYHNEREMLTECLESVKRQTVPPDEVVVFDDGSDVSAAKYVPSGLNVTVISNPSSRGPSFGRNAMLRASECAYVHFQDADDLFAPTWMAEVSDRLCSTGADVVFTELAAYSEGRLTTDHMMQLHRLLEWKDLTRFCLLEVMQTPSGTYRRDAIVELGGYSTSQWQSEDYEFHLRLALSEPSYEVLKRPLIQVRLRPGSRSRDRIQLHADAVACLQLHGDRVPSRLRGALGDALAWRGSQLYQLGATGLARRAFESAYELGNPTFADRELVYRMSAKVGGALFAETCASNYRRLFPESFRRLVRSTVSHASPSNGREDDRSPSRH